jgi:hypothetical protein
VDGHTQARRATAAAPQEAEVTVIIRTDPNDTGDPHAAKIVASPAGGTRSTA